MCQEALTLHSTTVSQERETNRYPQFKDDKLWKAPDLGTQQSSSCDVRSLGSSLETSAGLVGQKLREAKPVM